jgi:GNAT superfamily N-acetyltransferase
MIEKCLAVYREQGALECCSRMIRKLSFGRISTNGAIWYAKNLTEHSIQVWVRPSIPVSVEFCSFQETLDWIRGLKEPWMVNDTEQIIAMEEKHYWGNVKTDQCIIGYLKIGMNRVYINDYGRTLTFAEGVAFIYDTFVLPEYRNKNVATYLIQKGCCFLEAKGLSRAFCHIPAWNKASAKTYAKVGFAPARPIRFFRVLGLTFLTSDPTHL